jgi:penicillin-binding protein 1A
MTQPEESQEKKPSRLRRWALRLLVAAGCLVFLVIVGIGGMLLYFSSSLPKFDSLEDYQPPQVTRMYDRNGRVVAELFEEKRTVVPLERIPQHVRQAFLAAEDADFYSHPGLDFTGMLRALWRNLVAGRVVQGGSTITQQVIKTFILGPERSYSRKIREILLALRLESNLTKDEILSLYLNQIYFGHRCYGVQEASRFYFGKDVAELSLPQGAMLAALPKSPAGYSPIRHPEKARQRRDWVLDQMEKNNMAPADEIEKAQEQELEIVGQSADFFQLAPYYAEHCRRLLEEKLGREKLYEGGLRVELAVDLDMQQAAQKATRRGLRWVDRRQGYRGPVGQLSAEDLVALKNDIKDAEADSRIWTLLPPPQTADSTEKPWKFKLLEACAECRALVPVTGIKGKGKKAKAIVDLGTKKAELSLTQVKWARKFSPVAQTKKPKSVSEVLSVGDVVEVEIEDADQKRLTVRLSQPPRVQGALVAIDPHNRHVLALVGGSDFKKSPLIRATQSRRQPGSAFKPILYAAAIRTGAYTPTTVMMDTPEVYRASLRGSSWKPRNFERVFVGAVSLRYALAHSINTIAVKIGADIGVESIIKMAHALGVGSELTSNLSITLGASEVTPIELTNAYATLASGGLAAEPVFITSITDPSGEPVELFEEQEPVQAIGAAEAFVVTSLLRSVIEEGTGKKALKLNRPLAGKTGTANQQRDGWFVGYSPDLATGVWVGFDDHSRMGTGWAQGAGTALPIWVDFMEAALAQRPRKDFRAPAGVVFARVDPDNGLLASPKLVGARLEVFVEGTEPRSESSRAGQNPDMTSNGGTTPTSGTDERIPEGLFR